MDNKANDNRMDHQKSVAVVEGNQNSTVTPSPSTSSSSISARASNTSEGSVAGSAGMLNIFVSTSSLTNTTTHTPPSSSKGKWNKKEQGKHPPGKPNSVQHPLDRVGGKNKYSKNYQQGYRSQGGKEGEKPYNKKSQRHQDWDGHSDSGDSGYYKPHFDKKSRVYEQPRQKKEGNSVTQRPPSRNGEAKVGHYPPGPFVPSFSKDILKSGSTIAGVPNSKLFSSSTLVKNNESTARSSQPIFANKDERLKSITAKFCKLTPTETVQVTSTMTVTDKPQVPSDTNTSSEAVLKRDIDHNSEVTVHTVNFTPLQKEDNNSVVSDKELVAKLAQTLGSLYLGSGSDLLAKANEEPKYQSDPFKELEDIFGSTSNFVQEPRTDSSSASIPTNDVATTTETKTPDALIIDNLITPIITTTADSSISSTVSSTILIPSIAVMGESPSAVNENDLAAATKPPVALMSINTCVTSSQLEGNGRNEDNCPTPRIPWTELVRQHREDIEKRKAEAALELKTEKKPRGKFAKNFAAPNRSLFNRENVDPKILEQTQKLPMYHRKEELIKLIRENQFVIVIGDTGCGKSTQIPQYIAEAGLHRNGMIGVTQPRRVAAKSLAIRVAAECGVQLGSAVGYSVRFEKNVTEKTVIKYMTSGTLVKECTCSDSGLDEYSVIMIDEAHERRIDTDVCFGLLKRAAFKRPGLKVIISSTTLEQEKFSEFFNNAPVFKVSGESYKVAILYEPKTEFDYMKWAVNIVININRKRPRGTSKGDILVFLPGQEEIDEMWCMLEKAMNRVKCNSLYDDLIITPCYRGMLLEDQQQIFEETPENCRKVVLATNIAETSITIGGIAFVIDCGFFKQNQYNPYSGIYSLKTRRITKFQAIQRAGRAGRNCEGECYRLYREDEFLSKMEETEEPEVTRSSLESMILTVLSLGITDPRDFPFMDAPPDEALVRAIIRLLELSAIEVLANATKLTDLGRCMVEFPLDPPLAKVVIESEKLGCSSEVLKIVALLSFQTVFLRNRRNREEADLAREKFYHPRGDLLTLLNIHSEWEKSNRSEKWCKSHCLNYGNLSETEKIQSQIKKVLKGRRGSPQSESSSPPQLSNLEESILKAFTAGYFHQLARKAPTTRDTYQVLGDEVGNESARLHPSSSLRENLPQWVIYQQILTTKKTYMKEVSVIDPKWIAECAPDFANRVADFGVPT